MQKVKSTPVNEIITKSIKPPEVKKAKSAAFKKTLVRKQTMIEQD